MADKPQAAGMPQPTEEHKKLHLLAGDWEGEEMLSPSPWGPGGPAFGRYTMRLAADGFFVVQDYVEEKDGQVVFRGHGIYGWDAGQKTYTWYWVDSMGQVPPAPSRGRWEGNTLTFESTSPQGGGRYTHTFDGPNPSSYRFTLENSFDGGKSWVKLMEGNYRKKR